MNVYFKIKLQIHLQLQIGLWLLGWLADVLFGWYSQEIAAKSGWQPRYQDTVFVQP